MGIQQQVQDLVHHKYKILENLKFQKKIMISIIIDLLYPNQNKLLVFQLTQL